MVYRKDRVEGTLWILWIIRQFSLRKIQRTLGICERWIHGTTWSQ